MYINVVDQFREQHLDRYKVFILYNLKFKMSNIIIFYFVYIRNGISEWHVLNNDKAEYHVKFTFYHLQIDSVCEVMVDSTINPFAKSRQYKKLKKNITATVFNGGLKSSRVNKVL